MKFGLFFMSIYISLLENVEGQRHQPFFYHLLLTSEMELGSNQACDSTTSDTKFHAL